MVLAGFWRTLNAQRSTLNPPLSTLPWSPRPSPGCLPTIARQGDGGCWVTFRLRYGAMADRSPGSPVDRKSGNCAWDRPPDRRWRPRETARVDCLPSRRRGITLPSPVTWIIRAWLKGQRRKYCINPWIPSRSPDRQAAGLRLQTGGLQTPAWVFRSRLLTACERIAANRRAFLHRRFTLQPTAYSLQPTASSLLDVATVQESLHSPGDDPPAPRLRWAGRSPKTIALLVAFCINPLELRIEPLDPPSPRLRRAGQLIKRRLLRLPWTIKTDLLLCLTHHNPHP